MKALVYHGPGEKAWETTADPGLQEPTDIVVKVDTTTICGTDLHILKGDVPAVTDGRVLGHEAVATVVETGSAVSTLREGDRVIVPAITSCGRCAYCKRGLAAHEQVLFLADILPTGYEIGVAAAGEHDALKVVLRA